jgi:hypothetical protein
MRLLRCHGRKLSQSITLNVVILVKMGVIRPLKGATLQDLEYFENYMYMSAIYPGLIGFFLIVIGAYRALRRKKIFR